VDAPRAFGHAACEQGLTLHPAASARSARAPAPGYRVDLALAVITCIIQIPVIRNWSGYPYLTVFQMMRIHRVIMGIRPIGALLVRPGGSTSLLGFSLALTRPHARARASCRAASRYRRKKPSAPSAPSRTSCCA